MENSSKMEKWLRDRLSLCLDFPIPDEMINYILSMKTSDEVDEYFQTLLNYDLPEHRLFINDFKQRLFGKFTGNNQAKVSKPLFPSGRKQDRSKSEQSGGGQSGMALNKKKQKYVNLYTQDGQLNDTILLQGRHRCDCQASKHKLINNCIKCGRIVCEQEGSGPCLFCSNLVCTEEEMKTIRSSTKKGDNLKKSLMEQGRPKGLEEALAERNRLLEYDRAGEKRTTVIDDESDYFKANSVWLSDAERKKLERLEEDLQEKKHASRLSRKVTIDFAGREVIDEPQITKEYEDEILQEIARSCTNNIYANTANKSDSNETNNGEIFDDVHPSFEGTPPVYIPSNTNSTQYKRKVDTKEPEYDGIYNRVQDKEILEMQDMGHCMSMHQPWASLLVAGIKRHEGRPWYTAHRGRLWIASTVKPVDLEEIKRMENFYRVIYNDDNIKFPSQYPSGCLLGCVSVDDCLPQEEYRKVYPEGESDSPFVFICKDFQELPIHFPIKGMHKIYKLDNKIHVAAVKTLQRIAKLKADNKTT